MIAEVFELITKIYLFFYIFKNLIGQTVDQKRGYFQSLSFLIPLIGFFAYNTLLVYVGTDVIFSFFQNDDMKLAIALVGIITFHLGFEIAKMFTSRVHMEETKNASLLNVLFFNLVFSTIAFLLFFVIAITVSFFNQV